MKKLLILASIVTLTSVSTAYGCNCPQPCKCAAPNEIQAPKFEDLSKCQHKHLTKLKNALKLTDEQKAQLENYKKSQDEKIEGLKNKIVELEQSKKPIFEEKLTLKERMDKLTPIDTEIEKLHQDMRNIHREGKDYFRSILTKSQLKTLDKLKKNRIKNCKGKPGPRFDRPMEPHDFPPPPPTVNREI